MGVEEHAGVPSASRVTRLRVAEPAAPDPMELIERAIHITFGLASLAAGLVTQAVAVSLREEGSESPDDGADDEESPPKPLLPILVGASIGVAIETGRLGVRAASTLGRSMAPWASFATSPRFVRDRLERARKAAEDFDGRWREEQAEGEEDAGAFLRALVPKVIEAVLDQVDLTEVVLELDLDRVVKGLDLDRVLDRIDVDAIAGRIDLDRIVAGVDLRRVMERIDIQDIVDRVDIDAVAARIDIESVVQRIDLGAIAQRVIDQLDLGTIAKDVIDEINLSQIVRESTGTMANETVEGIRVQGMGADRAVSRFVDRVLRRDGERDDAEDGA